MEVEGFEVEGFEVESRKSTLANSTSASWQKSNWPKSSILKGWTNPIKLRAKVGVPEGWAQNFAFFLLPLEITLFVLSLGIYAWNFGPDDPGTQTCT